MEMVNFTYIISLGSRPPHADFKGPSSLYLNTLDSLFITVNDIGLPVRSGVSILNAFHVSDVDTNLLLLLTLFILFLDCYYAQ